MGLFSGTMSYVRYGVGDGAPDNIKEFVLEKIKASAFKEIQAGSQMDKSTGWVSAENMASTFFDDLHFAKDPYLVFSLRVDVKQIPPLALKAARLREEAQFKEATSQERLGKKDRDMLKEQVWQALIKRALPAPAVYELCWNTATGTVLFFSTAKKANEEFVGYFYRSFDIRLSPLGPCAPSGQPGEEAAGHEIYFDRDLTGAAAAGGMELKPS